MAYVLYKDGRIRKVPAPEARRLGARGKIVVWAHSKAGVKSWIKQWGWKKYRGWKKQWELKKPRRRRKNPFIKYLPKIKI
jgi:hypothetical protein